MTTGWPVLCTLIRLPDTKDAAKYREIANFLEEKGRDRSGARPDFLHFPPTSAAQAVVELLPKRGALYEDARLIEKAGSCSDLEHQSYHTLPEAGGESFLNLEMRVRSFVADMKAESFGKSVVMLVEPVWASMFRRIVLRHSVKLFFDYPETKLLKPCYKAIYEPKLRHPELPLEELQWNVPLI